MKAEVKFTALHRLLHWVIALAMSVLFITGFLRMFWMNKNRLVSIMESETSALSKQQMTNIAVNIREPMWEWHELFAYVMIIAFIIRIIYMMVNGIRFVNPFRNNLQIKERLHGIIYIYFYAFVFLSAFTGICISYQLLTSWEEEMEAVHKWGLYWFPIFILLHLAGIVLVEYSQKKGIVSKMIGGDKGN